MEENGRKMDENSIFSFFINNFILKIERKWKKIERKWNLQTDDFLNFICCLKKMESCFVENWRQQNSPFSRKFNWYLDFLPFSSTQRKLWKIDENCPIFVHSQIVSHPLFSLHFRPFSRSYKKIKACPFSFHFLPFSMGNGRKWKENGHIHKKKIEVK